MLSNDKTVSNKITKINAEPIQVSPIPASNTGLAIRNIDDLARLSQMLASSNFFADARDAAQCGVKVLAGLEMGFGAFQSMTGIHIIKGKPAVGAGLIAAKIKASGKYDYEVLQHDEKACILAFYENEFKSDVKALKRQVLRGEVTSEEFNKRIKMIALGISSFTYEDAKKAGTQNLDKFARNMLFARAISNGQKWFCPDVFSTSVYTPEELGANVDEDGYVIPDSQRQLQQYTPPQDDVENQMKNAYADQVLVLVRDLGMSKSQAIHILQTRYKKATRDQLSLTELEDLVKYLEDLKQTSQDQGEYVENFE